MTNSLLECLDLKTAKIVIINPTEGNCHQSINFEQSVDGQLNDATPTVSYCLDVSTQSWASIRMFASTGTFDPYLKLYAPDGSLIAENDNGVGIGLNSFLSVQLSENGAYRVEAGRSGTGTGDFRLRLEEGREAAVGDIDRNCSVNQADLDTLLAVYGTNDVQADLDLNGFVNLLDLNILLANMGQTCGGGPITPTSCFSDEFSTSSLSSGWTWIDPLNDSSYSLTANPGSLRIATSGGSHDLNPGFDFNAPRILQPISGDFDVATKVTIDPIHLFQSAGLVAWFDQSNFAWIGRSTADEIAPVFFRAGQQLSAQGIQGVTSTTVYLRMQKTGDTLATYYSPNRSDWTLVKSAEYPSAPSIASVGLFLINNHQDNPIAADFDDFRCAGESPIFSIFVPIIQASDDAGSD
jgi:regulation of enolase protein 1 (concanavalin A-like superfamily)